MFSSRVVYVQALAGQIIANSNEVTLVPALHQNGS